MSRLRWPTYFAVVGSLLITSGCMSMISNSMSKTLSNAILNQDDPALVRDGAPAYLLLIDGLIMDSPDSEGLLVAGAKLNGAYASIFAADKKRAKHMAAKALRYARSAMCQSQASICAAEKGPFPAFRESLQDTSKSQLPVLFAYASAWAGQIQANSSDWLAIADMPKVEALLERIIELDPGFENGQPHLYLGVMRSQIPPSLGGKPAQGKKHFETAIQLSKNQDMMAKVLYAENYARLMFEQELHDRLLKEVLEGNPRVRGLTLTNTLAQQRAEQLMISGKDYF
ncbi:MAG: TRAP transporter TatT component family protein [Gammaproteobacteria bacterium]|nr:TRAP transporter TatT component family protein [Gammaproteobacteria bacterium]